MLPIGYTPPICRYCYYCNTIYVCIYAVYDKEFNFDRQSVGK